MFPKGEIKMLEEVFDAVGGVVEEYPIATAVGTIVGLVAYKYIQHKMIMKGVENTVHQIIKQEKKQKKQKKSKKQKEETEE